MDDCGWLILLNTPYYQIKWWKALRWWKLISILVCLAVFKYFHCNLYMVLSLHCCWSHSVLSAAEVWCVIRFICEMRGQGWEKACLWVMARSPASQVSSHNLLLTERQPIRQPCAPGPAGRRASALLHRLSSLLCLYSPLERVSTERSLRWLSPWLHS